ncbi:hypothetical protein PPMP20_01085 [Paraburkholderia phymatum]|nr:hypothetical protein [Paraburkholderia phymatum]
MQYVFSMTSRMVTIAATCAVLLCILLFLLGVEIGTRMSHSSADTRATSSAGVAASAATVPVASGNASPAADAQSSSPAPADIAALPASSTL